MTKMPEGEQKNQINSPHPGTEQEGLNSRIIYQELLQILFVQSCLNPPVQPFRWAKFAQKAEAKTSLNFGFSYTWRLNSQQQRKVPLPRIKIIKKS